MSYPSREAYRERSVSAMYVGVSGLRKALQAKLGATQPDANMAVDHMRTTWSDLRAAKAQATGINQRIDQYEVNAARRVSMAESLFGSRKSGLAIGVKAVGLAFMSESPRLDTANLNFTPRERIQAKVKAFAGGLASIGVGILASPKPNQRRTLALRLADRAL